MSIQEFRQQYPEYNDISDVELINRLYEKFYKDSMTKQEFCQWMGVQPPTQQEAFHAQISQPFDLAEFFGTAVGVFLFQRVLYWVLGRFIKTEWLNFFSINTLLFLLSFKSPYPFAFYLVIFIDFIHLARKTQKQQKGKTMNRPSNPMPSVVSSHSQTARGSTSFRDWFRKNKLTIFILLNVCVLSFPMWDKLEVKRTHRRIEDSKVAFILSPPYSFDSEIEYRISFGRTALNLIVLNLIIAAFNHCDLTTLLKQRTAPSSTHRHY